MGKKLCSSSFSFLLNKINLRYKAYVPRWSGP